MDRWYFSQSLLRLACKSSKTLNLGAPDLVELVPRLINQMYLKFLVPNIHKTFCFLFSLSTKVRDTDDIRHCSDKQNTFNRSGEFNSVV